MALMAPDFTSCFACSVAVAVSTMGCSDSAEWRGKEASCWPAVRKVGPQAAHFLALTAFDTALAGCAAATLLLQSQQRLFLGTRMRTERLVRASA